MNGCDFAYVGRWCGSKGCAHVVLIAENWVVTAEHVARNKVVNPGAVNVEVRFSDLGGNVSIARVAEAFASRICVGPAFNWEVALARLDHPIEGVSCVTLAENGPPDGREVKVAIVATELITPAYCRLNQAGHLDRNPNRGSAIPGVGGDSGGAWVAEGANRGRDVLLGVIQGGRGQGWGAASQPSVFRDWIDHTMRLHGAIATWATLGYA
jgi:hypothetical protein